MWRGAPSVYSGACYSQLAFILAGVLIMAGNLLAGFAITGTVASGANTTCTITRAITLYDAFVSSGMEWAMNAT